MKKLSSVRYIAFAAILGALAWVAPAPAQTITTADAVGVVSDSSGAVVPGAKVTHQVARNG